MDINVTAKAKALFSHYDYVDTQEEKNYAITHPEYSWHVNKIVWNRKKWLVFLNDASPLTIVIHDVNAERKKYLKTLFEDTLRFACYQWDIEDDIFEKYIERAGDWKINSTLGRSFVGSLNEQVMVAGQMLPMADNEEPFVAKDLSEQIVKHNGKYTYINDGLNVIRGKDIN